MKDLMGQPLPPDAPASSAEEPVSDIDRVCALYAEGKLGMEEAAAMLWMKGIDTSDSHWILCAAREQDWSSPKVIPPIAFKCAARRQSLPEPADCNWPMCGCDPYADKVMEALDEHGIRLISQPDVVAEMDKRDADHARFVIKTTIIRHDLLTALKGLVEITVNPHDGGEFEHGEFPALDAARAAIAKAEGRS